MRVLHIGKYLPPFAGGMEYFLADLLKAQSAAGVEVAALVHEHRPRRGGSGPAEGETIQVYRAPCHGRLLYAPISPAFPAWLHRIIGSFAPHVLHLHLPNTSAFAAMAVPRARRLPWVVHWHSDVVASSLDYRLALAYALYRPFESKLLEASRAIVATSPSYLASSNALQPWRNRCHVVPLSIDPNRIPDPDAQSAQEAESLWGRDRQRVLAIGRLTYYKGHETLIQAAQLDPMNQVLIVGAGEREPELEALIRQLGVQDRVRLLGFMPDSTLNALLASCDLVCLPSIERTEAFGLVLLEAMRFGKPVVVSDIPGSGTGWVVREGRHGILTTPGNASELAQAMTRLRNEPSLRQELGESGRAALVNRFGLQQIAESLARIYSSVIA